MGDANPICTLGDYFKHSHEGYRNTIQLPVGNNVVPLRSDTIRLVQNGCSFHRLWSEDPNQHLKDFLKLVDSLNLDGENRERMRLQGLQNFAMISLCSNNIKENLSQKHGLITIDQSAGGKLRDRNAKESCALLEDLALCDNESWNDPRDFAKQVKAISLPQDVPSTFDRGLIVFENQVQRLMETHLAPTLSKFEADFKQQQSEMTNKIDIVLKAITDSIAGALPSDTVKNPKLSTSLVLSAQKVCKLNSFIELSGLVPQSPETEIVCTKVDDGDIMFIEIIRKNDDSREEGPKDEGSTMIEGLEVEYFDKFLTKSELAYHRLYLMRRSLEVLRKFHWMILGGRFNQLSHVSSPLLSKPGEY
ncbi:hypothetical protein Tco_1256422 [Tanacetum coccineum]